MMMRSLRNGLRALFGRDARNAEIAEELRSFEEQSIAEKMRRGMTRENAERAVRRETGSAESVRHMVWSAGWESVAEGIWQDVRYGVRQLLHSAGFALTAILSLALGIGANTAIFTLMNDLLLKQLPVRDPQKLVSFGDGTGSGVMELSSPGGYDVFPYEFYRRIAAQPEMPLEGVTAFASFPTVVSVRSGSGAAGPATQATSHLVSGTFFSVLEAEPMMGRVFDAQDTAVPGRNPVAVISHSYWQQELASDPQAVGRTIMVNGTAFTVIGVMPPQFYGIDLNEQAPDMWLPISMQAQVTLGPTLLQPEGPFWIHVLGRLRPGVSAATAQAWVTPQFQRFLTDRAGAAISSDRRKQIAGTFVPLLPVGPGLSYIRQDFEKPLEVLMGMVGVVLLIACANLANLLLAKTAGREREFASRMALGSGRARIVRQILTETLTLAAAGGVLGLCLAYAGTTALVHFLAGDATHTALSAAPDLHVLAFTFAVCAGTGLLFGLAPALRGSRARLASSLNAHARTVAGACRRGRLVPQALVVSQVMLSVVLVGMAALLLRTLHNLESQDTGMDRTHVLVVRTNPKFAGYQATQLNALYDQIVDRMDSLPGVKSAAISGGPPMANGSWGSPITIAGRPVKQDEDVDTQLNRVSAGYFETLGIPLLRGRTIAAQDTGSALRAAVVNQTMAEKYFPKGDAIGHTFTVADPGVQGTWQIVGIVKDAKYNRPGEEPRPFTYLSLEQLTGDDAYGYFLQLRAAGDPRQIAGEVRASMAQIDPNLPILRLETLNETVDDQVHVQKFVSQLSAFFSLLALTLACVGLYGVMTYGVVRRTNEIGVRMALGASRGGVLWLVLRESLLLLGVGLALGLPAALAANRLIRAGLFGVSATDPWTLLGSMAAITVVILCAGYLPARRATRIDPMVALRYE
jgi:predicted permease